MSNRSGGGGGGMSAIPAASRKIVQSLKEIVNCPEPEIYHMLKECNMDPNEAVNRLLSQDPFHEVKSKREKKKENKDGSEHRNRSAYNSSNRGSRSGADRYAGRAGSNQFGSNDSGALHNRPTYRKENVSQGYAGSSAPDVVGNSFNRRLPSYSESVATENKVPSVATHDPASSFIQPAFQSAWSGAPGQVSMADIVKMGRPHNKAPGMPNQPQHKVPSQSRSASEPQDEWPLIEQPSNVNASSLLELPAESDSKLDQKSYLPVHEDFPIETQHSNHAESVRHMHEDDSKGTPHFDNDISYQDKSSYQLDGHAFEHKEAEDDVTSAASHMQQLYLEKDDQGEQSEDDNPPVIIPDHLQVHAPECSQLSFGSFRCGVDSSLSGPFASKPSEGYLDATSSESEVAAVAHPDTGNAEYYRDENLKTESTENLIHGRGPSAGNYDAAVSHYGDENLKAQSTENLFQGSGPSAGNYEAPVSQPEVLQHDAPEPAEGNQYAFASSESDHGYQNHQQLNAAAYSQSLTNPHMQNLATFSNVMQAYTSSAQSTLLPSSVQTARESDLSYSPFSGTQSIPMKYHTGSSISGPTISMSEALRAAAGSISSPQPTQQIPPGANMTAGSAVPQQLLHPYSQPTLPLGHFANMISYPFLPQNYTYMPPAFQQAFSNNSAYHQSLAAMLPQYKNSASVSSLPQSAAVASGYGFGNSTNIPGQNFALNIPAAPGITSVGFDEVLSSHYKDNSHIMSLQQQNDNSAMWVHGAGSRTMSPVPANTYYSFPGQSQQPPGFRQTQQPSQDFGALGYPNYYQNGMPLDQQQNARDGSLGGSQGQQVKQTQQLWQNGY